MADQADAPALTPAEANGRETTVSLSVKRAAEMAAVFMIGDGALGLLQAARHVDLWRSPIGALDVVVKPFAGKAGRRRLYGLVQIGAGVLLASRLKPRK
jgi:hypothetical protein